MHWRSSCGDYAVGAITGRGWRALSAIFPIRRRSIAYGAHVSVEALVAPIVGGLGTVFGPVIGALALHGIGEMTKLYAGRIPGIDLVIFGVILVPPSRLPRKVWWVWQGRLGQTRLAVERTG